MKILANDGISEVGKSALIEAGMQFLEIKVAQNHLIECINENQIDILIVRSATEVRKELIDACPSLKIIGRGGIGMDNIDVEYARSKGIWVINTPTASSRSVAELVFAHFFSLARFLHESNRLMPLEGELKFNFLKKSFSDAVELQGKNLGIIGFGSIGKEVAKIGISMGMNVEVFTRNPKNETLTLEFPQGKSLQYEIRTTQNLHTFLSQQDFLSIHTPKSDNYILDKDEFDVMKTGAYLVNTARGGVVNEMELIHALETGKIAGAALDVFEKEPHPDLMLLMNPKLSLSPHVGGNTIDAQEKIGLELAYQIIHFFKN